MNSGSSTSNNSKCVLLIGSNCINNQFIQREIEKNSDVSLKRQCTRQIEQCPHTKTPEVVLVSYLLLVDDEHILSTLAKILSEKWIVYDVPKNIDEEFFTDIHFSNVVNLKGIIYQDAPIEHLTRCLSTVLADDFWLPRKVMARMLADARPYALKFQEAQTELTKRELQVFRKLVEGASNLAISEDLYISESTVKTHIYKIYKKLHVTNRKEAIRKAAHISDTDVT